MPFSVDLHQDIMDWSAVWESGTCMSCHTRLHFYFVITNTNYCMRLNYTALLSVFNVRKNIKIQLYRFMQYSRNSAMFIVCPTYFM